MMVHGAGQFCWTFRVFLAVCKCWIFLGVTICAGTVHMPSTVNNKKVLNSSDSVVAGEPVVSEWRRWSGV